MDEKIKSLLNSKKIKITDARYMILNILSNHNSPMNYEQIKAKMPFSMDKATFYRNILTFEKKGLVNKFESKDRVSYYELGKGNHAHFMCEKCQKIVCIDIPVPFKLDEYHITNITLKGKCKECFNQ